jgi:hypothetical protein
MLSLVLGVAVHSLRLHFAETHRGQQGNHALPPSVITTQRSQNTSLLFQNMGIPTVPNPLLTTTSKALTADTDLICLASQMEQQISTATVPKKDNTEN